MVVFAILLPFLVTLHRMRFISNNAAIMSSNYVGRKKTLNISSLML